MDKSYWATKLAERIGRRKTVVGGLSLTGGAAALLAGCGGDGSTIQPAKALRTSSTTSQRQGRCSRRRVIRDSLDTMDWPARPQRSWVGLRPGSFPSRATFEEGRS